MTLASGKRWHRVVLTGAAIADDPILEPAVHYPTPGPSSRLETVQAPQNDPGEYLGLRGPGTAGVMKGRVAAVSAGSR